MQKATNAYVQTAVTTTSPGEILLMLYTGGINYLEQAKVKIEAKDYAGKGILISKAMDVLNELSSSLNREKGGDLADNLNNLYFWCTSKLAMANLKLDTKLVDEVIKVLSGLRSAYAEIMKTPEAQARDAELAANQRLESSQPMRVPNAPPPLVQGMAAPAAGQRRQAAYTQQQNFSD